MLEQFLRRIGKRFELHRDEDVSGISGTGFVAHGYVLPTKSAVVMWHGENPSIVYWPKGMASVEKIHGHEGRTRILFDGPDPREDGS